MLGVPQFFIPGATRKDQEELYATYAKWCDRPVPTAAERIYSITYVHEGDHWTATVGKTLSGTGRAKKTQRGSPSERPRFLSDPARVLAIFPGNPYLVVTNYRIAASVRSAWENPFMAGRPTSVTYFFLKADHRAPVEVAARVSRRKK